MEMEEVIFQLRERLKNAVSLNHAEGILFSGGLDTAILSYLNPNSFAINVSLDSFGEDILYAKSLAKHFNLKLYCKSVTVEEAIEAIPQVVRILKSFDPAIPNDLVVYFGLKVAKKRGFEEIMTGDGADELFAGYSYMQEMKNLKSYLERLSKFMYFNSNILGEFLNIKIKQPYMDRELVDFSLTVSPDLKIRKEKERIWGKWILRKAFEGLLPSGSIWQDKRPLEYGSGMSELRKIISSKVSDEEFKQKKKSYGIKFFNKEHLYYYEVYRKEVGEIPKPENSQKECPGCGAGMKKDAFHCYLCGWVETIR